MWWFYTFDITKFENLVGSKNETIAQTVIEAATWEDENEELSRAASNLVMNGFDADNCSEDNLKTYDELFQILFSPEGLSDELDIKPISPDGVHPSLIVEMLEHAKDTSMTQMLINLKSGRRYKQVFTSDCEYCILTTNEVAALHNEVEKIINHGHNWSEQSYPSVLKECLLDVLTTAQNNGNAVIALLG